jgi:hypothetical protein
MAEGNERPHAVLLARVRQGSVLTCGSCESAATVAKSAKSCTEERAKDRLQAQQRVDFALFNIPCIAKLDVRQRFKHGGVAEPIVLCATIPVRK